MSSRPPPQQMNSQSLNPSSLMEINVLKRVAMEQQASNNVRGSIPYLAKICQIMDNQRHSNRSANRQLDAVRADAHAQLADAYFRVQNFVQCEASLMVAVKIWERQLVPPPPPPSSSPTRPEDAGNNGDDNGDASATAATARARLGPAYDALRTCYDTLGKSRLAEMMELRKSKLSD